MNTSNFLTLSHRDETTVELRDGDLIVIRQVVLFANQSEISIPDPASARLLADALLRAATQMEAGFGKSPEA